MATSDVAIANRALQKLGEARIEALTQDDPNARSMNACFVALRKSMLRKYVWGFAVKRESIAADSDQTAWGDWNRFAKPNDFLRLIRDNETRRAPDWKIEGTFIVTMDSAPLDIRYVADIDDATMYDSLFDEAFASLLAYETCLEITGSTGRKDSALNDYNLAIAEAKRIGAIEKESDEFPEDSWLDARL